MELVYEITPLVFAILLNGFSGLQSRWLKSQASAFCKKTNLSSDYAAHIENFAESAISVTEFIAFLLSWLITFFTTVLEKWKGSSSGLSIILILTLTSGLAFVVWVFFAIATYGTQISTKRIRRLFRRRVGKAYGWKYPTVFRAAEIILNLILISLIVFLFEQVS